MLNRVNDEPFTFAWTMFWEEHERKTSTSTWPTQGVPRGRDKNGYYAIGALRIRVITQSSTMRLSPARGQLEHGTRTTIGACHPREHIPAEHLDAKHRREYENRVEDGRTREVGPEAVDWVERLHGPVDEASAPIERVNSKRLQCRQGCSDCCTDGLTVLLIEAAVIQRHHADLLERGDPRPPGACAFLDGEGRCRIYAQRPYVCRTQGLPLRWLEEDENEDIVRVT